MGDGNCARRDHLAHISMAGKVIRSEHMVVSSDIEMQMLEVLKNLWQGLRIPQRLRQESRGE